MKIQKQNARGITLMTLIIAIIIMIILATVSIGLVNNGDIFNKAKKATEDYKFETAKGDFVPYVNEYNKKVGLKISEETIEKIAIASVETGVNSNKFMVWHDKKAIEDNIKDPNNQKIEEYIFYNWKKVTEDEIETLENKGYRCFIIDVNGDGYITSEDSLSKIDGLSNKIKVADDKEILIGDINEDGIVDSGDATGFVLIIANEISWDMLWETNTGSFYGDYYNEDFKNKQIVRTTEE